MDNEEPVGEVIPLTNVPLQVCETHFKPHDWTQCQSYVLNPDGSIQCKFCGWGTFLPGYMRYINNKVVDLRKL